MKRNFVVAIILAVALILFAVVAFASTGGDRTINSQNAPQASMLVQVTDNQQGMTEQYVLELVGSKAVGEELIMRCKEIAGEPDICNIGSGMDIIAYNLDDTTGMLIILNGVPIYKVKGNDGNYYNVDANGNPTVIPCVTVDVNW